MSQKKIHKCSANIAVQRPIAANNWFVDPPKGKTDKFFQRGGNDVVLINCGQDYLEKLHAEIEAAEKNIYILIWGFDPNLPLKLDSTNEEDRFGVVLEKKARSGIEVKIIVWYQVVAVTFTSSSDGGKNDASFKKNDPWNDRARHGEIPNLRLVLRDPAGSVKSDRTDEVVENINKEIAKVQSWRKERKLTMFKSFEIEKLRKKEALLKKVGYGAYHSQQQRLCEDDYGNKLVDCEPITTAKIGSFPTHHQKTVLIDHTLDKAVGFVQGFNFWEKYFDEPEHHYRHDFNRIQDVGLRLKGSCLIDVYNNFSQGWNQEAGAASAPVPISPPEIKPKGNYNCQILRTWRNDDEFNIYAFYTKSLRQLNCFIYVEDQYFREPEFIRILKERAKEIETNPRKKLYLFIITNPNIEAVGGANVRIGMTEELNQPEINTTEEDYIALQKDENKLEEMKKRMEKAGVMVHVCRLRNYSQKSVRGKQIGTHYNSSMHVPLPTYEYTYETIYGSIYVHSKLTIFDDAYLTLGSANWNHRSMFTDTELNIAVQYHDDKARKFREGIWAKHLNGQWSPEKKDCSVTTPKNWYDRWETLLRKNFFAYIDKKPLIMNLFPYYEDLKKVKETGIINSMKQGNI